VEHYAEIVTKVTPPLALAALFFLLIFASLGQILKGKGSGYLPQLIRYGFIVALVLVFLANLSYIFIHTARSEMLFRGTVTDAANEGPLSSVIVDVLGISGIKTLRGMLKVKV
jgi:hypothetical protein